MTAMLLRKDAGLGNTRFADAGMLAAAALGSDPHGHRTGSGCDGFRVGLTTRLAISSVSVATPRDGFEMILQKPALSLSPWGTIAIVSMRLEGVKRTSAMTNIPESTIQAWQYEQGCRSMKKRSDLFESGLPASV
jgi:hypothetical protein